MNKNSRLTLLRMAIILLLGIPSFAPATLPARAAFPGNNGKIVFESMMDGRMQIVLANPDGSGRTPISTEPNRNDSDPEWSPDGTKIAFGSVLHFPPPNEVGGQIFVMNADGSGRTLLSDGHFEGKPCWSPDGTKIAFNFGGIWVMNSDGSDRVQLIVGAYKDADWSPDGTKIAFVGTQGIYVMSPDGSNVTLLGETGADSPSWSPDGTQIVFANADDIYVMGADGSNPTKLTSEDPNEFDFNPSWSPDGTTIVFSRWQSPNGPYGQLWTMNADGTGQAQITFGSSEFNPDWQRLPGPPLLRCPSDIAVSTDLAECSAVVEFAVQATGYPTPTVTCTPDSGSIFPLGTTTVTCNAANGVSPDAFCSFDVTVSDLDPPVITNASATPSTITRPNHRMVDVVVSYLATDNCSGETSCSLTVTSNEPIEGFGNGDRSPDWEVVDAHHVRVRAERSGTGTGRVYTISITCTDAAGNSSTAATTVAVPHGY